MSSAPASLLTASEATLRLGARGQQRLLEFVREGRLQGFRFPDGAPGFSSADLDALVRPMSAEETIAALEGSASASPTAPSPSATPTVQGLLQRLEQMAQRLAANPKWATAAKIQVLYGVDRRRLSDLVGRGLVKKAKMGKEHQASSLYRVEDLDRFLENVADGRMDP